MANVSADLQWGVIRRSSSYLIKRQNLTATKEPFNLKNKNSFRYNGLVHNKTVGVESSADGKGVVFVTRNKQLNKPSKNYSRTTLSSRNPRKAFKTIVNGTKKNKYRTDLKMPALRRASTLMRVQKRQAKSSA